jgi:hypothetical protein
MAQKTSTAHQTIDRDTPRVSLRLARGPGAASPGLRLARGPSAPSGESPPRSRPPPTHDAAPTPPTRALNALARRGHSGQRRIPATTGPLTPPGNRIPALFHQPALCGHPQRCAGAVRKGQCQLQDTVPPTPVPPPMSHPSKEDGGTLERGTAICPAPAQDGAVTSDQRSASPSSLLALCGHPRHCATFSGTAAPSPPLWEPGTMRHRHTGRCASSSPPSAQPSR